MATALQVPPGLANSQLNKSPNGKPEDKAVLTGKQEHYLKRELISQQAKWEVSELSTPTALQRFGAPFRSDRGEVAPVDSELPILRYIFVNHVRNFPFLDKAKEKEFWQDKLQTFLESFAIKGISSSEDRLEETKRRKLALKCEKLVELMMNSAISTASGYEERITFDEIEVVDRGAQEDGLHLNVPEGHIINGWDVNVIGVRQIWERRTVRAHLYAHYLIRSKRDGQPDALVARRYRDFVQLRRGLRSEFPGKMIPSVPHRDDSSQELDLPTTYSSFAGGYGDADSIGSKSSSASSSSDFRRDLPSTAGTETGKRNLRNTSLGISFLSSIASRSSISINRSISSMSSTSVDKSIASVSSTSVNRVEATTLWRETQRILLRAYLRTLLADAQIAKSNTMRKFLTENPTALSKDEKKDEVKRKQMDNRRVEEQSRFYEAARKRARELDVYMESFRRDIVEDNGLSKLFAEIRQKKKPEELSVNYQKFAEWLKIEVAATIYHIFLAEDNSPEMFALFKRIHTLIPYSLLKNIIRITNPTTVMSGILDLFMVSPFGSRSLSQRILGMALHDGMRQLQRSIDAVVPKVGDAAICSKLKQYVYTDDETKREIREASKLDKQNVNGLAQDAAGQDTQHGNELILAILLSDQLQLELQQDQKKRILDSWNAWDKAAESIDGETNDDAELFSYLKQLLKLYIRQRDKEMMIAIIDEPVSLQLLRDLFMIFYDPLVRVYKSANVYNSVTHFAEFLDDMIGVVERARKQELASDPNQIVQSFIDLCTRHADNFYRFVHEVHLHDNGLFQKLMEWIEDILHFLREGPKAGPLDINKLFNEAIENGVINEEAAKKDIDNLIQWHAARKIWHENKTRQKMAKAKTEGVEWRTPVPEHGFKGSDFCLDEDILEELDDESEEEEGEVADDNVDPLEAERRKRARNQELLRRRAGEPKKPDVKEIYKLNREFVKALRGVLAQ